NTIKGAGYGVTLRWVSETLIDDNEIRDVYSDAVHTHRSHDVTITNNRIFSSGSGLAFYASSRNAIRSNTITDCDRAVFLHGSSQNTIEGNALSGAVEGLVVASSSGNLLRSNSILSTEEAAWDDGQNNVWRGNYWPPGAPTTIPPNAARDLEPSGVMLPLIPAVATAPTPLPFQEMVDRSISIRDAQVWQGTRIVNGSIVIDSGGSLTLRGATLSYAVTGPSANIWIHVRPGGTLIIEDSRIIGPEWDHTLSIKVYKGATFTMKRSELHNAGSWVGTFAAAIANEADNLTIEDSTFVGTYAALSGEGGPANTRFVNNTIRGAVKGVALIGPHPGAVITGNRISETAIWGIGMWPYAGFATSRVSDNTFSDSWGVGLYNFFNAGGFEFARNTFTNVKGAGAFVMERNARTDGRQPHLVSTSVSAAKAGDTVKAVVRLGNVLTFRQPPPDSITFVVTLSANGKPVQTQRIPLRLGQIERVRLQAAVTESAAYDISIDTEP
ncbi:MAG TPA: right-handed parallel beta-helix repeat-containing protein, partial [Thermoanaerobaculia bacterium]|nr:right-handed parallel beta-helix repeat-containing protein [Thermoanaerobaculia bacterium]